MVSFLKFQISLNYITEKEHAGGLKLNRFFLLPNVKISQTRMPKDHTSLWIENLDSLSASGGIHLWGKKIPLAL